MPNNYDHVNGYTIKEILDKIIIPKIDDLAKEVSELKSAVPLRLELDNQFHESQQDIKLLFTWKNRLLGGLAVIMGLVSSGLSKVFIGW